ncbi:MAG: MopE-related protein, partial [Polyangiaceae bacterium]
MHTRLRSRRGMGAGALGGVIEGLTRLRVLAPLVVLGVATIARDAGAAPNAPTHLIISEVGYDTPTETANASSEFVEIFNPTNSTIVLNPQSSTGTTPGAGFFISDSSRASTLPASGNGGYYRVVNATTSALIPMSSTADSIFQFPPNTSIPPKGTIVVASNALAFLTDFFGGSLANFTSLPGSPQLFETFDSTIDVPLMTRWSNSTASGGNTLTLTNSADSVFLYYWDGSNDLVQDVDIVVWGTTASDYPNKGGQTVDGPDTGTTGTTYAADQGTALSVPAETNAGGTSNKFSLQRKSILEYGEVTSGGNGYGSSDRDDETSENFCTGASCVNPSAWLYGVYTPGTPFLRSDGSIADAIGFLPPVAISAADGPTGSASPADLGDDGTLTELYLGFIDLDAANTTNTDLDYLPESLFVAVRGSLFGQPNGTANAAYVVFDFDPGSGATPVGAKNFVGPGNGLNDSNGALDSKLTNAGFSVTSITGQGFDGAVGLDEYAPTATSAVGWRTWGSAGTQGTVSLFTSIGTTSSVLFDAAVPPELVTPGTTYQAPEGFEASILFSTLRPNASTAIPSYIRAVAFIAGDTFGTPSPNTLPESSSDSATSPHVIEKAVCFNVAKGRAVIYYTDADQDGFGGTVSSYCGPPIAGYSTVGGDCNDNAATALPGGTEVCDGLDNNCDGNVDEGITFSTYYRDADGDGFGNAALSTSACAQPSGYVLNATDCDDSNGATYPTASEVCNGV